MAKPIATSAVPETRSSKDGGVIDFRESQDIPLRELWAELVKDKEAK